MAPPVPALIAPVKVDSSGKSGPTPGQSRGPSWRRTSPGLYVPAAAREDLVEQRILEAYVGAGPNAVVTGWAGLRLLGGGYFDGHAHDGRSALPVPIASNGGRVRSRPGVTVVGNVVPHDEVTWISGIRCAVAPRSLFDEVRRIGAEGGDDWDQFAAVDMACAAQLTSIRRMARYRWTRYWYRDIRTLDRILVNCSEDSASPWEVALRRVWTQDVGWAAPLCNRNVYELGSRALVGIPDLFDPDRGVAGEYAGADHRRKDQHDSDLSRGAAFARVGIEVVEVTNTHLEQPGLVATWLIEAEERASLLPKRWQLGEVGMSLDEILDRRDHLQALRRT